MAKKVFLSPSNQFRNTYAWGNTNEGYQCGEIAKLLQIELKRCGFEVTLMHDYDMSEKVAKADSWGADLYIPIHSNACNGKADGTRLFCWDMSGNGYKACKDIFEYLAGITPGTTDLIKADPTLYEIKHPNAPTAYIETDFHDVPTIAKWIVEHKRDIVVAICKGVCKYFGVAYKTDEPPKKAAAETLYRVQVGAFRNKKYAEDMKDKLKASGYDAFVVTVQK